VLLTEGVSDLLDGGVALFDGEFEVEGVEDKETLELREIERAGVFDGVFEDAEDDKKILSKFYE
jgi:hypothetical protein